MRLTIYKELSDDIEILLGCILYAPMKGREQFNNWQWINQLVNHQNFAHFSISQTPLYWETNEIAHRSRDDEIVIDRSCCFERYRLLDHQPADFLSSKIEWFIFRLHAMTSTFKWIISVIWTTSLLYWISGQTSYFLLMKYKQTK